VAHLGDIRNVVGFPGVAGHPQIIGLFDRKWASSRAGKRWAGCDPERSTLRHFAIEIALCDYQPTLEYLTERGLRPNTSTHPWIGGRSIYVSDP
jgi:catechol 2,3-dioxygenase